jgi:hypothetical protein
MNSDHPFGQWLSNAVGGGALFASVMGWFPVMVTMIGAIVAVIWYSIQIAESETVRRWMTNRRARKVAKLRAKLILLEAKPPLPPAPTA